MSLVMVINCISYIVYCILYIATETRKSAPTSSNLIVPKDRIRNQNKIKNSQFVDCGVRLFEESEEVEGSAPTCILSPRGFGNFKKGPGGNERRDG